MNTCKRFQCLFWVHFEVLIVNEFQNAYQTSCKVKIGRCDKCDIAMKVNFSLYMHISNNHV